MAAGYAAALAAGGVLFAYTKAFFTSPLHREDPHALPVGEQYINERGRMLALIEELEQIPFEPVTIRSRDGLKLYGRYYHVREGAPVQIQVHGYRGSALRDFCGGSKLAREMGMNILLVDQRAHGGSGGRTITFGIRERWDCLSWAEYAAERFGDVDIYLVGVSMGAASVLMASELDLPENVAGIIADCPFSSPEAIIAKVCREDLHLPQPLAVAFVVCGGCHARRLQSQGSQRSGGSGPYAHTCAADSRRRRQVRALRYEPRDIRGLSVAQDAGDLPGSGTRFELHS